MGRYLVHEAETEPSFSRRRRDLNTLLGAGALGLLAGFAVPVLGALAAAGLVLYFLGALWAHLRVRNYQLGVWAVYLCLAVAALALNLSYHGMW